MYNLIIIGSGPGGYHTAAEAARLGMSVAIIEQADAGGTCLNCGCIPTKALCRTAEAIETIRHAGELAIKLPTSSDGTAIEPEVDFLAAIARKDAIVGQLRSGVEQLMQMPGITMLKGTASLVDEHTVSVDGEQITAENIIIATGSKPKMLNIPGIDLEGVIDSTALLSLKRKPQSIVIVGAGVIGMEMASVLNSFGVKVTVVEFLKECLPMLDSDIAKRLRQQLTKRGIDFSMQSACSEIRRQGDVLEVVFTRKGKEETAQGELVLIATGRMPHTDGLNLEVLGIQTERGAISVDSDFRTTCPSIWAIGDVNARCMLAHAATMQGLHVLKCIKGEPTNIRHDIMPSAIFTLPEAACVGLSEDQAKAKIAESGSADKPIIRKAMYRACGKAVAMGETEGMVKLIAEPNGTIVGCHAYGAHAADIVQEASALMTMGATLSQLSEIIHIHPTLGEMLWEAAL